MSHVGYANLLHSALIQNLDTDQRMILSYITHRQAAKAQTSLRIRAVSSEPTLLPHTKGKEERPDQTLDL